MSGPSHQTQSEDYQAVDRISSLPDALICHILSFIRTKSALKTSVLAKRWRYIWRNVPALDFSEMPCLKRNKTLTWQQKIYFKNFVDRILIHNDVPFLQSLRFYLFQGDDYHIYIFSWLRAIYWRKIREIEIYCDLFPRQPYYVSLPICFLSRERLVVLKLEGNFTIDVPEPLHLPSLEIIRLAGILFPCDEFIKSLLLGCPVLKELEIVYYYGISMLNVESLSLKKLEIVAPLGPYRVPLSCVVIKAPNLMYLRLENPLTQYDICDLNLLVEANLEISNFHDDKNAFEMLSKVSSVHTLKLGSVTERLFTSVSNPPVFGNLTCLQLDWVNESAHQILEFTPKLKSLSAVRVIRWDCSYEDKSGPGCLLYLENVELCKFKGRKEEVRFVAYFLEAASVLKQMKISLEPVYRRRERIACQKLLKLPRSSIACQVELNFSKF